MFTSNNTGGVLYQAILIGLNRGNMELNSAPFV